MPKKGGLGKFADLRGAWQERGGGVFEGGWVDILMHAMVDGMPSKNLPSLFSSLNLHAVNLLIWKKIISLTLFKIINGCVRYIFANLFCMSKREHLWNQEKCFLFHIESSFYSWDNQILNFQIFKCYDVIKCLSMKHKRHFIG